MKSKINTLLFVLLCGCNSSPSDKSNVLTSLPTYNVSELSFGSNQSAILLPLGGQIGSMLTYAISGDGNTIIVTSPNGNNGVWVSQLKNNIWGPFTQIPGTPVFRYGPIVFMVISADGKTVAISGNYPNSVWIAQQDSSGTWGSFTQTPTGSSDIVLWMSMSDDGSKTAVVLGDKNTFIPVGVGMVTTTNGVSNWITLSNVGFDRVKISGDGNTLLLSSSYSGIYASTSLWITNISNNQNNPFTPVGGFEREADQLSLLINQNGDTILSLTNDFNTKNRSLQYYVAGQEIDPTVSLPEIYNPAVSLSGDGNTMVLLSQDPPGSSIWIAQKNTSGWSEFSRLTLHTSYQFVSNMFPDLYSQWMSQDASTIILGFDVQNNQLVLASTKTFSTSQCSARQTNCNGVCVNTSSDPNNCGSCGNVCGNYCSQYNFAGGLNGCSSYQQESCAQGTCQANNW